MLVPASQGENAAVEYALNGVASFVTAAGREQLRPAVCEGLLAALARCKDDANRAFLVSQLPTLRDGRQCRRTGRLHR